MIYMIYEKKLKARRVGEWEGRDQRREKKKKEEDVVQETSNMKTYL